MIASEGLISIHQRGVAYGCQGLSTPTPIGAIGSASGP